MPSIYDLIGMQDPLAGVFPGRPQRQPMFPAPPQEVEDSLLSYLAGGGLSALGYVGSTLDKPGAAVRGLLAGDVGQLANLIPFSDTLGITNEADRVSGRDLLEQYGMLGANTPGLDWGDAAGFGAEVLLDPLTYLSFGGSALTKAGRAADAAGDLARATYGAGGELLQGARAAQIGAGQRGLIGAGLPFMDNVAIAGTGPWAQKIAGGLDTAEHALRYGNPIGRMVGGLFDPAVHDATTQAGQIAMKELDPQLQAADAAARLQLIEQAQQLREMGYLQNNPAEAAAFRSYMEGVQPLAQEYAQAQPVLDQLRNYLDSALMGERDLAMQTPELSDLYASYVPRQRTTFPTETASGGRQSAFPTEHPFQTGREEFLKNIPGGTEAINKMSLDPALSGAATQPILNRINAVKASYGIADDGQAKDLAEWLGSLPAEHMQAKLPVFGNHPVYDILNRFVAGKRSQAAVEGVYDFLGKNLENVRSTDNVHVGDVLQRAGLDRGRALAEFVARNPNTDVTRGFVPKEIAADVGRMLKAFQSPEPVGMFIGALDKFTNAFKVSALTRPSRWVRDFYSGQFMNWVTGLFSPRGLTGAHSIMTDGLNATINGIENVPMFKGLTREQATQKVVSLAFAHRVVQPFGGEFADLIGPGVSGSKMLGEIPGGVPQTLKSTFVDPFTQPGAVNPLRTRGVGMPGKIAHETQFAPVKVSENVSHYTDGLNRLGPFIEGLMQGLDPAVAARKVKLAQVDYSALTATERNAMKRVLPFYSFTRRMIPAVFKELMEKPGGRLAQTIRLENESRDDQFIPPYMAPGLAIRLPESMSSGTGDARFVTSIDLPHEAVFQLFRPSNTVLGTLEQTGMGLAGMAHPLIKAPLEVATGKQFYSGRDLSDLDSRIGRVLNPDAPPEIPVLADQLLMNLPVTSPLLTTLGTMLDPRKGAISKSVNLLSGVKVSDVDVPMSRDRVARDAIEELLQGNPAVRTNTNMYVPRELLDTLTPDEQLLLQVHGSIKQRSRERAKQNAGAGRL